LQTFEGCLGEFAAGHLTQEEISQVRVLGASNYGMLVTTTENFIWPKLEVVLAHNNVYAPRAVVSHTTDRTCILQLRNCVHCAVRALLAESDGKYILIDGMSFGRVDAEGEIKNA
jgi:hypothetical protein